MEHAKGKVRRFEVPTTELQDGNDITEPNEFLFEAGAVLNGKITLPTSHAGEEFLHILLDGDTDWEDEDDVKPQ